MTDLSRLNNLFHEYSDADVVTATKSTEAFLNEVFDITTSDGEHYFLKILNEQHPEAIAGEVQMQQRMLAAGLRTPEYLEITPGNHVGQHHDEKFLLSKYIPGSTPRKVTPTLIQSLGAMLAMLHDCLDGMTVPENDMQWLSPKKVHADLDPYDGETKDVLTKMVDYGSKIFELGLPEAIIHGDLWLSNIFAEDGTVTAVFDLETAERTARIIDLGRTYTSIRFNSDFAAEEVVAGLAKGYDSKATHPLSAEELQNMYRAIAWVCGACATWHAVRGRRYRDHYIKLGVEAMGN